MPAPTTRTAVWLTFRLIDGRADPVVNDFFRIDPHDRAAVRRCQPDYKDVAPYNSARNVLPSSSPRPQ